MKTIYMRVSTILFYLSMFASSAATASVILSPTAVIGNTMGTAGGTTDNIINQTGLAPGFVSGVTDFAVYIATNPVHDRNDASNAWAGDSEGFGSPVLGNIEFDLGDIYQLSSLALWSQSNMNGIDSFSIFTSLDAAFTSVTDIGTFNAAVLSPITAQTFAMPSTAQFVRLKINSNHGGSNVNIGEVAFEVSNVPIPAAVWLFGSGLVGLACITRRKKAA